jgi:hypothetical protein
MANSFDHDDDCQQLVSLGVFVAVVVSIVFFSPANTVLLNLLWLIGITAAFWFLLLCRVRRIARFVFRKRP